MTNDKTQSTELLEIIFENTHTLIAYLDKDMNFIRVNKAYALADGKEPDYFVGKGHFDLFPYEDNEIIFRRVIETGEPYFSYAKPFEYEQNPERGMTHWDWSLVPVKDKQGAVTSLIMHLVDVTDRIKAEEKLKLEERLNRAFIESSQALMTVLDSQGRIVRFNRACEETTQYQSNEIVGKYVWDVLLLPEEKESVKNVFQNLNESALPNEYDNYWITKDGSKRFIHWSNNVLKNESGIVQYIISVGIDITESKSVEKELENIFELSIDMIGAGNLQGYFYKINSSFKRVLGYEDKEFMAKPFIDYVYEDDLEETIAILQEAATGKEDLYAVNRYKCKDGTLKWIEWNVIANAKDNTFYATGRDITERKKDEAELSKYRHQLEELVEQRTNELHEAQDELVRKGRLATLGQLTATVSHELRNPLGAMRPSMYVIEKASDKNDERVQKAIERVDRNIDRCDNIIDELLDFTRITELDFAPVVIDEWVESLIDEQIVPEGLNIDKDLTLKKLKANIDADRLRRAFINVFENAIHSMMDDNKKLIKTKCARLAIKTTEENNRVEIIIADTGLGIEKDVLDKIFEPLFSTKSFGVGLGMPTVKQIMEQHGGGIEIESEEGKGTTIILWLPLNI